MSLYIHVTQVYSKDCDTRSCSSDALNIMCTFLFIVENMGDKTASLDDLLEESRLREEATVDVAVQGPVKFGVFISFMEIYNDQIFDLLDPPPKKKHMRRNVLQLKEDKNGVPFVRGACVVCSFEYRLLTLFE